MAMHDGHRDRMRERISKNGIESLQEHEILEYILYSQIPRKDTNPIAHQLIKEFGSLSAVFDADPERLVGIKGISQNTAIFLNSLSGIFRIYDKDDHSNTPLLNTTQACVNFMAPQMATLAKEEVHVLLKNSVGKLIKQIAVSKGTVNESSIYTREIADLALKHNATSVVLVHNHPSGVANASPSDITLTQQISVILNLIGIPLDDHIIIGKNNYYSFYQSGELRKLSNSDVSLSNGKIKDIRY